MCQPNWLGVARRMKRCMYPFSRSRNGGEAYHYQSTKMIHWRYVFKLLILFAIDSIYPYCHRVAAPLFDCFPASVVVFISDTFDILFEGMK